MNREKKMTRELYQALATVERLIGEVEWEDQNHAIMDIMKAVARSRCDDGAFIIEMEGLAKDALEEMYFEDQEHNPSMEGAIMALEAWAE